MIHSMMLTLILKRLMKQIPETEALVETDSDMLADANAPNEADVDTEADAR